MRLAAGCQFRGADDSLPIVVANLVALGFDVIYLVDHLSESIALPLLQRLAAGRCELRVIRKPTTPFAQSGVHSLLMQLAQRDGAHAYLPVDSDEFPAAAIDTAPSAFRDAVHRWLSESTTDSLLLPNQNHLQRRDVERWNANTLDAPAHRILGAASGVPDTTVGYLGRTPNVRAMARLDPGGAVHRWVRLGAHRVYGRDNDRRGATVSMEASPDLVMLHLPYPSRSALDARLRMRANDDGTVNRDDSSAHWADVSMPADPADPHPGPPVRTAPSDAFGRMRDSIAEAGLLDVLADEQLNDQRVALQPSENDELFALAADLLAATIVPRDDGRDAERINSD